MKTVLYILRTRSEVDEIFNYHRNDKKAHKAYSSAERWIEYKDGYKVWYKTKDQLETLKGMSYDQAVLPLSLKDTDVFKFIILPSLALSKQKDKITWVDDEN